MKLPAVLVAVSLLAIGGVGYSQVPQPGTIPPPGVPLFPVPQPLPPSPLPEPTVEQMLDSLESLRVQKAELEKKEREIVASINKKIDKQTERMKKLGLEKPPVVPAPAPTIPIVIERIPDSPPPATSK